MTELILLLQAEIDIQSAFNRYDDYQSNRGRIFLQRHPEIGSAFASPFRRMLVRDFPYGVFYEVQPKRLVVVAVLDLRRDPDLIRRRLFGLSENSTKYADAYAGGRSVVVSSQSPPSPSPLPAPARTGPAAVS